MNNLTTLCYMEKDGAYLLLRRNKKADDLNHEKWIGVGGHFEENESPEECLLREVKEETGLELTSFKFRGIVTFVSDEWGTEYMHLFTADGWRGREKGPDGCDEGELVWVKKKDLFSLNLWEGDRIFLSLLAGDEPFFSLKLAYEGDRLKDAILNGNRLQFSPY